MDFIEIAKNAKSAAQKLATLSTEIKNKALLDIADSLEANKIDIFEANYTDLKFAEEKVKNGEITSSTFNRLKLDENKMRDMIGGIRDLAKLPDPINQVRLERELDNGLILRKISCPIGVLGIIFEARPDVIAQISSLAIKSANAVIMKGGSESINTNKKILEIINTTLDRVENFPPNVLNQVFTREEAGQMLGADEYINLIIPRGGNCLVKFVKDNTRIPVLGHADGICHIYIDEEADLDCAKRVVTDAKTQYPSACNTVETLLINTNFKNSSQILNHLHENGVDLIENPENWAHEYGDTKLSVKFVEDVFEAIEHINKYGSGHTDCIVTENGETADIFLKQVDSSGVYHNVSTRFADGFRYGFGAEVGISTNKTHARGPVGLDGLTIYKYTLCGEGHIVGDYVSGLKTFSHNDLSNEGK